MNKLIQEQIAFRLESDNVILCNKLKYPHKNKMISLIVAERKLNNDYLDLVYDKFKKILDQNKIKKVFELKIKKMDQSFLMISLFF